MFKPPTIIVLLSTFSFRSVDSHHFNYNVSWCEFLWVNHLLVLCTSWTWMAISFLSLEKFLAIISSNMFSASLSLSLSLSLSFSLSIYLYQSLSSFYDPCMWMLVCLMLACKFLNLSSFLFILFLFCVQLQ